VSQKTLLGIRYCVFDAYGTLFDVHSAVAPYKEQLGEAAEQVSVLWRTKQLEYTWLRSLMQRHADFWQVTKEALEYAFGAVGLSNPELFDRLMEAYMKLTCYSDVREALLRLKEKNIKTAILSNGSPKMLEAAVKNSQLFSLLDAIISVEKVRVFKPHPRVYQLAEDEFEVFKRDIVFLSSNAWDVAGAKAYGLKVVWVNRFQQRPEQLPYHADAEIRTLTELPELLGVA